MKYIYWLATMIGLGLYLFLSNTIQPRDWMIVLAIFATAARVTLLEENPKP